MMHTEPEPNDRVYYRRRSDGQLGYRVTQGSDEFVRLDRPNEVILEPLLPSMWIIERSTNPLNDFQIASLAFSADIILCKFLGIASKKKSWLDLRDEERILFAKDPPKHPLRRRLYNAISIALKPEPKSPV